MLQKRTVNLNSSSVTYCCDQSKPILIGLLAAAFNPEFSIGEKKHEAQFTQIFREKHGLPEAFLFKVSPLGYCPSHATHQCQSLSRFL